MKVTSHKSDSGWAWIPKVERTSHNIDLFAGGTKIDKCSVESFWLHWLWFDVGVIWGLKS